MRLAFTPQSSDPVSSAAPEKNPFAPPESQKTEQFPSAVENKADFLIEKERTENQSLAEQTPDVLEIPVQTPRSRSVPPQTNHRSPLDPLTFQIEKIMEEGIAEAYQELSPVQKQEFKIKGEQTARQIKALLQATKVKVKKIFRLLLEWLKLLPGINRFFLMQEAKIKTDKIMSLKNHRGK